ncbi:MAG: serine--tRNA ligase [Myxococcota bacterium]
MWQWNENVLDLKQLEAHPQDVVERLARRGSVPELTPLLGILQQRKQIAHQLQQNQEIRNQKSKLLQNASRDEIDAQREALHGLSKTIKQQQEQLRGLDEAVQKQSLHLPNIPRSDVPAGNDASDNVQVKQVGECRQASFCMRDHVEIGFMTGMLDQKRSAHVSGSRFAFLTGWGSSLNRALLQYCTQFHVEQGDQELTPPYLVRSASMQGTGQLPKFAEDAFAVRDTDLYLIPTAEVPLTNYFSGEILSQDNLPIRLCAYSPCFRAEAGAAGKETRGLIRLHQFEKVEMVRFVTSQQKDKELQQMVNRASTLLSRLELPHRIVELCAGDLGFAAEKTFDIEVWLPGQKRYCEISSCSSFGQFQARRINLRYRPRQDGQAKQKPQFLSTLNGSALPLGRTLAAIWENHQCADGSVRVPSVLKPYFQGPEVIEARAKSGVEG